MSAFGVVPRASVWPCARCVDANTSPSSIALQTPTHTASWPIATCRKPGSSPALNRSSTFSSKRRIRSMSRRKLASCSCESASLFATRATAPSLRILRPMRLVWQWVELERQLPETWTEARLGLEVREQDAERAAALLTGANPLRRENTIRLFVTRRGPFGPEALRRTLLRLDRRHIGGTLELEGTAEAAAEEGAPAARALAAAWEGALAGLPPDWSDIHAELVLGSSDHLERAALLAAPLNPLRHGAALALRFRVARRFGYGVSATMARRCFERLDEEGIRGDVRLLRVLSDTHNVGTQGPVWRVGGRAV